MYWEFELKSIQNTLLMTGDWQNHEVKLVNNHLIIFKNIFIHFCCAGLHCYVAFSSCSGRLLFVVLCGLLIAVGSPVAASLVAQMLENLPVMGETWVRKIPWRRPRQPTPVFLPGEFPGQQSLEG